MTSAALSVEQGTVPRKRWTHWTVINITCAAFLGWCLFYQVLGSFVRIGFDPQPNRCLPWILYIVRTSPPAQLERNTIYQYYAKGIPLMPEGTRVVKYVGAIAGDTVDVDAQGIRINDVQWGPLNPETLTKAHLTVADVTKHDTVPAGKVLMLGTEKPSYDGRYFGLIDATQISGRAYAVW